MRKRAITGIGNHVPVFTFMLALLALAPVGCDRSGQNTVEKSDAPRRIEVLVVPRASLQHDPEALTNALAAALTQRGINITYSTDSSALNEQGELRLFDAVIRLADDSLDLEAVDGEERRVTRVANVERDGWDEPAFAQTVEQAILRVVPPQVVQQWQAYAVPPLTYVDQPVLIPNYENRTPAPQLQEPLTPEQSLKHWQVPPDRKSVV